MMCYKDKTFCGGDGCCNFGTCHRALTQDVKDAAARTGLQISQEAYPRALPCWFFTFPQPPPSPTNPTTKKQHP